MSGYKRVNFYELCRLCASNQQKEKTHIFHEEGRKIQLQTKIQSLLSLKVCENDYLPKVVCSKCLQCLEECYTFRNECVTSESMLSSYFNNYRYKEDFTKTGKVYIKDIPQKPEPTNNNIIQEMDHHQEVTTVYLPEIKHSPDTKNQVFVNIKQPKRSSGHAEAITINSDGEIVKITPLLDMDGIIGAPAKKPKVQQQPKKVKTEKQETIFVEDGLVSFDVPQMHGTKRSIKTAYPVKTEGKTVKVSQNVIINPVTVPMAGGMRNVTLPLGNVNSNVTTQSYQNTLSTQKILETINSTTQKIVENFGTIGAQTCYYTNQMGYSQQLEQDICEQQDVKPTIIESVASLNTISPNWAENITMPQQQDKGKARTDAPKIFECDMCKKTFKRREHLYQHIKLHTGFRPFTCEHCNKSFMRKEHLLRHMTSHSGLKNFTCDVCEKSFSRNDNLLKHKKTHDKESNFACEICKKQFVMRHYYVAHKAACAGKVPGNAAVWPPKLEGPFPVPAE